MAHIDGDAGPVPGGGVLVCLGVPKAQEEGGLEEGGPVGCVVVHGLVFFLLRSCIRVERGEDVPLRMSTWLLSSLSGTHSPHFGISVSE